MELSQISEETIAPLFVDHMLLKMRSQEIPGKQMLVIDTCIFIRWVDAAEESFELSGRHEMRSIVQMVAAGREVEAEIVGDSIGDDAADFW